MALLLKRNKLVAVTWGCGCGDACVHKTGFLGSCGILLQPVLAIDGCSGAAQCMRSGANTLRAVWCVAACASVVLGVLRCMEFGLASPNQLVSSTCLLSVHLYNADIMLHTTVISTVACFCLLFYWYMQPLCLAYFNHYRTCCACCKHQQCIASNVYSAFFQI
jgi:hypothetical protein